jgi:hypothetical protein
MLVPTIDGDIDVGTCFQLSIDVGGLGPRCLVDYTANRKDQTRADVIVSAITIGWTAIECTGCKRCDRMHWVLSIDFRAIDTGCIGSTAIDVIGWYRSDLGCTIDAVECC